MSDRSVEDNPPPGVGEPTAATEPAAPEPAAPEPPKLPPEPQRRGGDGRRRGVVLVVLVAAIVAVGALLLARRGDEPAGTPASREGTTTTTATAPVEFVEFRDEATGFSMRHPKTWERLTHPSPEVRLVLSDGRLNAVLVRVTPTENPVTAENLLEAKAFTDAVVSGEGVTVLSQQPITLNGMPGFYYLYTFKDGDTGLEGAHSHYFVFQGRKMHSIVFQALPTAEFDALAGLFDQMAESVRSDPNVELPPTTSTTSTTTGG